MADPFLSEDLPALLWRLVSLSQNRLLVFDLDGTLAPFDPDRDHVRIHPGTLGLLQAIATSPSDELAILSGRPVRELARITTGLRATLIGEHGWEHLAEDGTRVRKPLPPGAATLLGLADAMVVEAGLEPLLERKYASRVLHTRALATARALEAEAVIERMWGPLSQRGGVRLDPIHGGLELRALGADKGSAIRTLMNGHVPPRLTVYVGDDTTDEDAFEAVNETGFGIRVGAPERSTMALGWIQDVHALPAFLEEWLRVTATRT